MLSQLLVLPAENRDASCELVYCPIEGGEVQPSRALELSILTGKNEAPVCRDVKLETYKNIANTGALDARDPEGDTLTYQLVKEPKRGTVDIAPDGSFTYTPAHNKVGRDSFVYTATDPAGNVSNEARVKIKIVKPTDAATFADLAGDPLEYRAMALKDMGVYGGREIAGQLCFAPDETVSRGEFLVMAMRVLGMEPDAAVLTSGFADEAATAAWMRPYITAAYRSGVISGVSAETGMEFRPNAALTKAECAVMLQNMLDLPQPDTQPVFSVEEGECIASWAVPSASALQSAGLELTPENARRFSRLHPRCGTAFLFLVMFISILIGAVADQVLFALFGIEKLTFLGRILRSLLTLPIVTGVSYEVLKGLAHAGDSVIVRILRWPGMMLQYLTTREPDDSMLEVAIASMKAAKAGPAHYGENLDANVYVYGAKGKKPEPAGDGQANENAPDEAREDEKEDEKNDEKKDGASA